MKYLLACIGIFFLIAIALFINGGIYNLSPGNVAYPEGVQPVYKICSGLTIVIGDPIAGHYDLPVNGICFGSVVDRPELTPDQEKKINGSQAFYVTFGEHGDVNEHDYKCKTDPLYDPVDPCKYRFGED